MVAAVIALIAAITCAVFTQLYLRATTQMMQARDDAAGLLALTIKHGECWGGSDGKNVPVDGYQAAGRLLGNPQASPLARDAAAAILEGSDEWPMVASEVVHALRNDAQAVQALRLLPSRTTAAPPGQVALRPKSRAESLPEPTRR